MSSRGNSFLLTGLPLVLSTNQSATAPSPTPNSNSIAEIFSADRLTLSSVAGDIPSDHEAVGLHHVGQCCQNKTYIKIPHSARILTNLLRAPRPEAYSGKNVHQLRKYGFVNAKQQCSGSCDKLPIKVRVSECTSESEVTKLKVCQCNMFNSRDFKTMHVGHASWSVGGGNAVTQ